MADTAHRLTDEKLDEMEKRLSAIYSRAEKTVGSIPTTKQTSIIYNSSNGKYYLWR